MTTRELRAPIRDPISCNATFARFALDKCRQITKIFSIVIMSAPSVSRVLLRRSVRQSAPRSIARTQRQAASSFLKRQDPARAQCLHLAKQQSSRSFSVSARPLAGLMPHTENPEPKESEPVLVNAAPSPLETEEFHELADHYLEEVLAKVEEIQEGREDIEVDYSVS